MSGKIYFKLVLLGLLLAISSSHMALANGQQLKTKQLPNGVSQDQWNHIKQQIMGTAQQQAYIKASNTDPDDAFSWSLAISGDTIVVSAVEEDSNAMIVGGDEMDNSFSNAGAAYVFVRTAGIWSQQAYLKPLNTDANDIFGWSVAISGDTIVVGAYGEDSNSTDVNQDDSNNLAFDAGAAYVFTRTAGIWSQQAYLKAANTDAFDFFGYSVAISGDTIVVGAYGESSNSAGVNQNESNNLATQAGAAYVFTRTAGIWSQQAYLKASNTDADDRFGWSVAISGSTIVAGAPREDSNTTGVNNGDNNLASNAGASYVFVRTASSWDQQAYLKASNTDINDVFGYSVAISGDSILVGAYGEDSNSTDVNVGDSDNSANAAGAAYVFVRTASSWDQQAYLKASNTDTDDFFGWSVAISGDTIVVGAYGEDSNAVDINNGESDNSASLAGAAYAFTRTAGIWSQQAYLKASNTDAFDFFGHSAAVSGNTLVIGAYLEDSNAVDVNNNDSDNSANAAGAAYVFQMGNDFQIGGMVAGLSGTGLILQNNGVDDLPINTNGNFTFATALTDNSSYMVTVLTQPVGQTCTVNNSSGTVSAANVTNVVVTCSDNINFYSIGGTVSNLTGTGLILQNNGSDDLAISTNGSFTFATTLADNSGYDVTVLTQAVGQSCTINNGTGTVSANNIINITVVCVVLGGIEVQTVPTLGLVGLLILIGLFVLLGIYTQPYFRKT